MSRIPHFVSAAVFLLCLAAAPVAAKSSGALVLRDAPHTSFALPERGVLGRSPDCEVVLESAPGGQLISRHHASIQFAGGRWLLQDIGSTNGTFVNGKRLDKGIDEALFDGDEVKLAGTVFVFRGGPKRK